jgi:hypothetical protein
MKQAAPCRRQLRALPSGLLARAFENLPPIRFCAALRVMEECKHAEQVESSWPDHAAALRAKRPRRARTSPTPSAVSRHRSASGDVSCRGLNAPHRRSLLVDSIGVSVASSPISHPQGGLSRTAALSDATTAIVSQSHARSDWWGMQWDIGHSRRLR